MDNLIAPYDFGNIVENVQRIDINNLVRQAQKDLKFKLLQAQIRALGVPVVLTASKTRFNGQRLWFLCPNCDKRVGIIYHANQLIACRKCLGLKYKKQRYKGMVESA